MMRTIRVQQTQQERRDEAESRLLDAAAILVSGHGTSRMTLAQVGEEAGYSRGLANHHFGTKRALIDRLVEEVRQDFGEAIAPALLASSPAERLTGVIRGFFDMVGDLSAQHRSFLVMWADSVATSPEIRPAMAKIDIEFRSGIESVIAAGLEGDDVNIIDPAALAVVILAILRGVALQYLIDPDSIDLELVTTESERVAQLALAPRR